MRNIHFCENTNEQTGANACINMLLRWYNISTSNTNIALGGDDFSIVAEKYGFRCFENSDVDYKSLKKNIVPFIIKTFEERYIIVFRISKGRVVYADPGKGIISLRRKEFEAQFCNKEGNISQNYIFQPSPKSFNKVLAPEKFFSVFSYYKCYFKPYRKYLVQIALGIILASVLQLCPPFLTRLLVDKAVRLRDTNMADIILWGMLAIAIGKISSQIIKDYLNFYVAQRVNISAVSDFFRRIMVQPIFFFEKRKVGDLIQRIGDHKKVETFIIDSVFNTAFSFLMLLIYCGIMIHYNIRIFAIFSVGSILYLLWAILFLRLRKQVDAKMFEHNSLNQSMQIRLLQGIQEIKLLGYEKEKRWEWERNQIGLLDSSLKMFKVNQAQTIGAMFINEVKNVLILYICALSVIDGDMSFGMMLAMQYIIGQAGQPINQVLKFIKDIQMAYISMKRLAQISEDKNEYANPEEFVNAMPTNKDITIKNLTFSYKTNSGSRVLNKVNMTIPYGKKVAIVGKSLIGMPRLPDQRILTIV